MASSSRSKATPACTKISSSFPNVIARSRGVNQTKIKFLSTNQGVRKARGRAGSRSPRLVRKVQLKQVEKVNSQKDKSKVEQESIQTGPPTNPQDLEKAFSIFDKNRDGSISKTEVGDVLEEADVQFTDEQLNVFMSKLDKDGNGDVDYDEFCTLMRDVVGTACRRESLMREAFQSLDVNGDGSITPGELKNAIGGTMTDQDATEVMRLADKDGDGEINYDEFSTMVHLLDLTPK